MKNTFLILIIGFAFGCLCKTSANEIFIADTTLRPLYPAVIRVRGSLDIPADSVEINLKYNKTQLNIINVFSDENNIFMEPVLKFYSIDANPDSIILVIKSKRINSAGKDFCNIKLSALFNQDSIFQLKPTNLIINGKKADSTFKTGNIRLLKTIKSEISFAYPNPFGYETKVGFTLFDEKEVSINIYNSSGRMVKNIDKNYEYPEFIFLDSESQVIRFHPEEKQTKGRYYMNWQPKIGFWPSGVYYIVFNIGGEIFQTNVILVK